MIMMNNNDIIVNIKQLLSSPDSINRELGITLCIGQGMTIKTIAELCIIDGWYYNMADRGFWSTQKYIYKLFNYRIKNYISTKRISKLNIDILNGGMDDYEYVDDNHMKSIFQMLFIKTIKSYCNDMQIKYKDD